MLATLSLLAAWAVSTAPSYTAASIGNAATSSAAVLAPNTLTTIYGANLSWSERALVPSDIRNGKLPYELAGVQVFLGSLRAHVIYASPRQVNFLVPGTLSPGEFDLWLTRDGVAGPKVRIRLAESSPGLFGTDDKTVIATHSDGSMITRDSAAAPGEIIVLYATGMGRTAPDSQDGEVPTIPARIRKLADIAILLNEEVLDASRILYAGVTPGCAGLYQINFRLPDPLPPNPDIRLFLGADGTPGGLSLPTK
jgi:uncharacterized protein (TIGR03437 family)